MTKKNLIQKVHDEGKEAVEKAYKTTIEIINQAKKDSPELLRRLVQKGEEEWEYAKKTIDKLFAENADKLKRFHNDLFKNLDDLRRRIIKDLPIDLHILDDVIRNIERRIGKIDIPSMKMNTSKNGLPIDNYQELSVKKILPHLSKMNKEQLMQIMDYEKKHSNRVTIIREINKIVN